MFDFWIGVAAGSGITLLLTAWLVNRVHREWCGIPDKSIALEDSTAGELVELREGVRGLLEKIVCTEGCDKGVVLLSNDGPTHTEVWNNLRVEVYDHEHFSPLGDALIELYELVSQPPAPAKPEGE